MTSSSPTIYPPRAIRFWIGLGLLGFAVFASIPFLLQREFVKEQVRFEACAKGQRLDCVPSAIWAFLGWDKKLSSN